MGVTTCIRRELAGITLDSKFCSRGGWIREHVHVAELERSRRITVTFRTSSSSLEHTIRDIVSLSVSGYGWDRGKREEFRCGIF